MEHFDRMVDEIFDELLITRWNCNGPSGFADRAGIAEYQDRYEVSLSAPQADPAAVEVEVNATRLTVSIPTAEGGMHSQSFQLGSAIDREKTEARWADGVLTVVMPKQKTRRIELKNI
jgi:HSP20 family molecular chaperone IbpA